MFRRKKNEDAPQTASYMVVGLGNPGQKYESSRHNCGFLAVDLLAEQEGIGRLRNVKCKATYALGQIAGQKVLLAKPQTFMNLSGEAVRDLSRAFSIEPERIIIIFDDADLPAGRVRVKRGGSAGTHNGMRNIVYLMESDRFPRIKVGIGAPDRGSGEDMADFVLSPMDSDAYAGVKAAPDAVRAILRGGVDTAMQEFNGKSFVE